MKYRTQHWDICIPIPNKYSLRILHLLLPKALLCCTSQIFSIVYACCVMSDIWSILSLIQSAWSTVLHHLDVMGTSACIYKHMQHYCSITNIMLCYLNTTILLEYRSFSSKWCSRLCESSVIEWRCAMLHHAMMFIIVISITNLFDPIMVYKKNCI